METEEKVLMNKVIRTYKGTNSFMLSLQKQLKSNKYLDKIEFKGKTVKILSDRQYETAKTCI